LHPSELDIQQITLERRRRPLFDASAKQVELVLCRGHDFIEEREISNRGEDVAVSRSDLGCQEALTI
jgi:hypothetical protein